ncbi:MAG: hypothetical protein M1827_004964 [Pycnora praestabilis]|nr:MAG: hypothetical protein M1827_004964 [Pycnora praestabilis]
MAGYRHDPRRGHPAFGGFGGMPIGGMGNIPGGGMRGMDPMEGMGGMGPRGGRSPMDRMGGMRGMPRRGMGGGDPRSGIGSMGSTAEWAGTPQTGMDPRGPMGGREFMESMGPMGGRGRMPGGGFGGMHDPMGGGGGRRGPIIDYDFKNFRGGPPRDPSEDYRKRGAAVARGYLRTSRPSMGMGGRDNFPDPRSGRGPMGGGGLPHGMFGPGLGGVSGHMPGRGARNVPRGANGLR